MIYNAWANFLNFIEGKLIDVTAYFFENKVEKYIRKEYAKLPKPIMKYKVRVDGNEFDWYNRETRETWVDEYLNKRYVDQYYGTSGEQDGDKKYYEFSAEVMQGRLKAFDLNMKVKIHSKRKQKIFRPYDWFDWPFLQYMTLMLCKYEAGGIAEDSVFDYQNPSTYEQKQFIKNLEKDFGID